MINLERIIIYIAICFLALGCGTDKPSVRKRVLKLDWPKITIELPDSFSVSYFLKIDNPWQKTDTETFFKHPNMKYADFIIYQGDRDLPAFIKSESIPLKIQKRKIKIDTVISNRIKFYTVQYSNLDGTDSYIGKALFYIDTNFYSIISGLNNDAVFLDAIKSIKRTTY